MNTNEQKIEPKTQYILGENSNLVEMLKDDAKPVEHPIKYKLKNAFEVFVLVKGTQNYWISNFGRCVNNLNTKDKARFYEHKQGNVHYTVFEIDIDGSRWKRETTPKDLVAETFLVRYPNRHKIWHKDSNLSNNFYKNLIYVTEKNYKDLKAGRLTLSQLNLEQEYIEYENKASSEAYSVYNGIKSRCGDTKNDDGIGRCYDDATMCKEWLDNPKSFVKWYLDHYYQVEGESMAVDKDLFGDGSKLYSPDNCCILPQVLNALLANCKKHYFKDANKDDGDLLPLGVNKAKNNRFYGKICFTGDTNSINLSQWETPEEAFAEYKLMKQANICMVAAKYKSLIPDYIYQALLKVEVNPY